MLDFQKLSADYQQALLGQVVPFWLKHSLDAPYGGYFDLLSGKGEVIEGDKFVHLQAQQIWAFAWLYNTLDAQPAWLDHARHGATFLSQFAHDDRLNCYAILDRRGRPVAPASDVIPDSFTVMAYAQLHQATAEDEWAMLAKQLFANLLNRHEVDREQQAQAVGDFRKLRYLNEPLAMLRAALGMQPLLDEEFYKATIERILHELLREFLDRRTDTLREFILPEGSFINTPEGRRLNVGLTFQTASALLDLCAESGNRKLAMQVVAWCLRLCEQAWDEATGGLNQYVDMKNQPFIFPDWQQKWAWVQLEAIAALMKGYFQTRHPDCPTWFKRIHDNTFATFVDTRHLGWHLALDQNNHPLLPAKAIPAVGCYSLIRCLAETAQALTRCGQLQPLGRHIRVGASPLS
ncbi:N-acyl-D-glucosamine 2-epimerase [Spirosoma taeanense]|uniref:N-acyl-D-glucosamine 2-epimerase n=1 Tax=Spirosoma taeanense TaxID=2735870 RepID=A0A6M5YD42_9BACT|nr:AGE family epimerase/isomerase [Spirosoma taeanense]QJW91948.1 N-acyl-D-glucosamine 2-epimerase [Spirosoma taeanense]